MDQKHIDIIRKNFSSLVERTSLQDLLPLLIEKNVLTPVMCEKYSDGSKDSKRDFYIKITQRGPHAYHKLVEALFETSHWDLVKLICPDNHLKAYNETFHSIANSKKKVDRKEVEAIPPVETNIALPEKLKIMSIKVIKSEQRCESYNPNIGCYRAKSKKRGICVFFNNIDYKNFDKRREGAEADHKNLEELFKQMDIDFQPHINKTKKEFENTLDEFAKSKLKGVESIFIIVSSHGEVDSANNDCVKCCDGQIIMDKEIINKFNNANCPVLQHVPKIFIFQKCRGKGYDFGCAPNINEETLKQSFNLSERTQFDGKDVDANMNTFSDILIVYSTLPGFVSLRDKEHGSWYFLAMCKVFMNHAYNTHIADLFKMADNELKEIDFEKNVIQTSHVSSWGFNRHLFLNPGYFEE